jgi:hypothetical protein
MAKVTGEAIDEIGKKIAKNKQDALDEMKELPTTAAEKTKTVSTNTKGITSKHKAMH